ncbi:tigger transposable element-derived protein 1-like [Trichogramma pretiosum]|uniref:tigger transposable element-derived protein 1-like n=1 Tax=Trichogramma pretiosum TaxID=7493 RepID=UPI000C71BEB0|nr:tigger transposable element-derived protein 1-like [Trichogramma pretiosum]
MLVYRAENPRALKRKQKEHLPVFWKSNKTAWVTAKTFTDWFTLSFVPEVRAFSSRENLSFKVLLLLDNCAALPDALMTSNPDVKILFLPPNTTSLIQPMDQSIIATFKSYYIKGVSRNILNSLHQSTSEDYVKQFWKNFNIAHSISIVDESWRMIKNTTLNNGWNNLLPELVEKNQVSEIQGHEQEQVIREAINIARSVGGEGFSDLQESELLDLVASVEALSVDEIDAIVQNTAAEEEMIADEEPKPVLTAKVVGNILADAERLIERALNYDPIMTRSLQFRQDIEKSLECYKNLYKDLLRRAKQKKNSIDLFDLRVLTPKSKLVLKNELFTFNNYLHSEQNNLFLWSFTVLEVG